MSIKTKVTKLKKTRASKVPIPDLKIDPEVPGLNGNTYQSPEQPLTRKSQSSPKKNWAFTYNNFKENEIQDLIVPTFTKYCESYTFSKEKGSVTKTPHLQGRFKLKVKRRITELQKIFGPWHFEEERNLNASAEYVVKDCKSIDDVFSNKLSTNDSAHVKFLKIKKSALKWFDIDETHYNDEIEDWVRTGHGDVCDFHDLEIIHNKPWWKFEIEYFWWYLDEYHIDDMDKYLGFMEVHVL